ncbi:MAG: sugar phosphate isomerase/epimerase family protein [Mariniphaga sp.]
MTSYKYGAHQFLWLEHWTDKNLDLLDEVRELGLDCFEISLGDDISFNPVPVKRRAEQLGLELTVGPGNLWPMECDISLESIENQRLGMAWHRRIIEQAAELGAVAYCGATYGHPGHVMRQPRQNAELERIAENLQKLADYAEKLKVQLVIEPMSRFRTHLLHTSQQAVDLALMVDHPNLLINLDTYHMITEERDYGKAIQIAGNKLVGIHACENDRGVPGGGLVPWKDVFNSLENSCPNARILMETYNTGHEGFGFKRGIFNNPCPDPKEFVRNGLLFLKNCTE